MLEAVLVSAALGIVVIAVVVRSALRRSRREVSRDDPGTPASSSGGEGAG